MKTEVEAYLTRKRIGYEQQITHKGTYFFVCRKKRDLGIFIICVEEGRDAVECMFVSDRFHLEGRQEAVDEFVSTINSKIGKGRVKFIKGSSQVVYQVAQVPETGHQITDEFIDEVWSTCQRFAKTLFPIIVYVGRR